MMTLIAMAYLGVAAAATGCQVVGHQKGQCQNIGSVKCSPGTPANGGVGMFQAGDFV